MKKRILSLFVMVSILVGMLSGVSFASTTSYSHVGYVLSAKYNYNFDTQNWYITLKMITENGLVDTYTVDGINEAFGDTNPRVGATPTGLLKGTMVEYSLNDMYVIDSIDASKGTAIAMQAYPSTNYPLDKFYYMSIEQRIGDSLFAAACGKSASRREIYELASDVEIITIDGDEYVGNEIVTHPQGFSDIITPQNANAIIQAKDKKIIRIFSFKSGITIPTNIFYSLSADGVFTISGTGAMDDYTSSIKAPWGTTGIKKVVIGEGITSIGRRAFYGCTELSEISIPSSVKSIGLEAFRGCTLLSEIAIPQTVESIDAFAFYGCSGLNSATIGAKSVGKSAFSDCSTLESLEITDNVSTIGDSAFYGCSALESIVIPDSVCTIGQSVFSNCTALKSANIPEGMTEIPGYVFSGCEALEEVTIPVSVATIGDRAFSTCDSLKEIYYGGSKEQWEQISIGYSNNFYSVRINYAVSDELIASGTCGENLTWVLSGDNVLTISGNGDMYDFSQTSEIPWYSVRDQIHRVVIENGVTTIGKQAFYLCTNLDSISIPEGVTKVGMGAFFYCTRISSITLPSSVKSIEEAAFMYCTKLTSVAMPKITTIGPRAFYSCCDLYAITIPDTVASISEGAFEGCSSIESIEIPYGITTIENHTFYACHSLSEITIPTSVTSIGAYAFDNCESLVEITIPDGVNSIGQYAFYDCKSLTSIEIPDGVTSIEMATFENCQGLTEVRIPASVTKIGDYAFRSCYKLSDIYYGGSRTAWLQAISNADDIPTTITVHCFEEYGTEISSCSYTENALSVTVSLKNNTAVNLQNSIAYVAVYSGAGKLKGIKQVKLGITANSSSGFSTKFTPYTFESGDFVKLMLCNAGSKPLCTSDTANVE